MLDVNGYSIGFLVFSLILALIPFGASTLLKKKGLNKGIFWVLSGIWFLFFPNIPYLFTKGRYLIGYCGDTAWDLCGNSWMIGYFFLHALIGVPLMYLSVRYAASALKRNSLAVNHLVLAVIMSIFSALALPIGLYGRFNSWHLLTQPSDVMSFSWNFITTNLAEVVVWAVIYVLVYLAVHIFVLFIQRRGLSES